MLLKKNQQRVARHYSDNYELTELNLIDNLIPCYGLKYKYSLVLMK